jgi:protein ImuB
MNRLAAHSCPEPAGPAATPTPGGVPRRPSVAPLWLCLGLPRLPLEVRSGGAHGGAHGGQDGGEDGREDGDESGPARVIVDRSGRVVQASARAAECGVAAGLPLNAALALCPGLAALERDEAAEQAALERLAAWAGAFTSVVSLEPPAALLLEVRGSLRLFGGLEALRTRIRTALRATGHAGRDAVAPTPLAALWLARAGQVVAVTDPAALAGRIGGLRPAVTGWPASTLAALRGLGIESLADCLRLPRDGFARRLGRGPLADLDRALGRIPDPRTAFRAPPRYRGTLELAAETTDTGRLAHALDSLFSELEGFLRARQRAVSRLVIRFGHLRRPASELVLGLVNPGLEAAHFSALFAERLERFALPAPAISVALEAEPGEPFDAATAGLFGDGPGAMAGMRLVERLRARLGREAVHGVCLLDEHRPEQAWRIAEPGAGGYRVVPAAAASTAVLDARAAAAPTSPIGARPGWLLESPRPLPCRDGRPRFDGALHLESGPERLETGWWDGGGIARDYWVARTPAGARVWIFRDLAAQAGTGGEGRWYLHGIFG